MLTIKDIAKLAKCSPSTVSKALNNKFDVSEKTRAKILKIAEKHNFHLHKIEQVNHKTENIGIVFCREEKPLSGNPFYSRVLEGIEAELAINNYNLILTLLAEPFNGQVPKMIKEHKVDGLIIVGAMEDEFIDILKNYKFPTVFVDPSDYNLGYQKVIIDNEQGGYLATRHIIEKGHKKIAFVSGSLERASFSLRFEGFKKAMAFFNIPVKSKYVKTGGLENGYEFVLELLRMEDRPTAIFFGNDANALLGYKAVNDLGLKVPEDISIVGFDDIAMAKFSDPPLSTVMVYKEEIGSIAVRKLLNQIVHGQDGIPVTTMMPVKFIERESVWDLKKSK
ncbi:MAG: LacI family DNA-binding transcriptional regulator [Candidatus Marinimicrobia bacterium]|nr:LacI family DNA-binding transcriptional regulator [Candidatus Neomarinimicrobiota bacterium]